MPPQTRKLLVLIQAMVKDVAQSHGCQPAEVRFTRRDIRAWTNWSDNQLKVHCMRLSEMEYLLLHGGSRGHLLQYELLWDGGSGDENHLCGLLDMDEQVGSKRKLDSEKSKLDSEESKLLPSCPQVGVKLGEEKAASTQAEQGLVTEVVGVVPNAVIRAKKKPAVSPSPSLPAVNNG